MFSYCWSVSPFFQAKSALFTLLWLSFLQKNVKPGAEKAAFRDYLFIFAAANMGKSCTVSS